MKSIRYSFEGNDARIVKGQCFTFKKKTTNHKRLTIRAAMPYNYKRQTFPAAFFVQRVGITLVLVISMPFLLFADTGETGASFLNLGVGASAIAMGGAVTSLSTGVHSLFWNPGGLGWLDGTEATLMHAEHFQSIRYENLGLAHGTNTLGMGFSVKGLYLTELEERTGPSANPISTFGAYFIVPSFSFAKSLNKNLSLGTNIKFIYQSIGEDNAVSYGGDIGTSIKSGIKGLRAGLALTNFGTKIRFQNSSFSLPTRLRTGLSYSLFNENASLAFDIVKPFKEDFEYHLGAAGMVMEKLCLRVGYRSGLQDNGSFAGVAAGAGFKIGDIDIDYAFSVYGVLGLTHNFSISYVFGRGERIKKKEEIRIAEELQRRAGLTAETFYQQGLTQQSEGKYDEALWNFDIALIWDPNYEDALKGIEELEKKINENKVIEHLANGIAEFKSVNYIEAVSEFGFVLEIDPTNEQAKEWLKTVSDALVKVHMERIKFEKEVKEKISNYLDKGLEHFSKKKYREAIGEWNKVISLDSTHKEAREYIEKAQLQIKEQIDETLKRVDMYISQSKWIKALNEVNRVLTLEPNNEDGLLKKQEIKKNLNSISKDHTQEGIKLYEQGKFGLAETEFKMALNFDVNNSTAKSYLAKIKSGKKEVSDEDVNELYMKGITVYTQEKYQLAIFYWKRVLDIEPNHANAKRNIERAEEKLKIYKK